MENEGVWKLLALALAGVASSVNVLAAVLFPGYAFVGVLLGCLRPQALWFPCRHTEQCNHSADEWHQTP